MNQSKRLLELDFGRTIPMLCMPLVHIYEELSIHQMLADGVWSQGVILKYLCMFGPSVFMISLGMNLVFSSHNSPKELARRGVHTILLFYGLNVLRYLIPGAVATAFGDSEAWAAALRGFLCADILFFAGVCFLFFALMKKLHVTPFHTLLIAVVMLTADTLIPEPKPESEFVAIALGKFLYVNGWSCFPVLTWMVFPAIGNCVGQVLVKMQSEEERAVFWKNIMLGSLVGAIATGICMYSYGLNPFLIAASPVNHYITDLANVVLDTFAAGILYAVFFAIYKLFKNTRVVPVFTSLSRGILIFYCVHWVIVSGLVYTLLSFGLRHQKVFELGHVFVFGIIIMAVSVWLTQMIQKRNQKIRQAKPKA